MLPQVIEREKLGPKLGPGDYILADGPNFWREFLNSGPRALGPETRRESQRTLKPIHHQKNSAKKVKMKSIKM